jgi:murein DD-endopeptidase MepM/ murein hydrolase activator NlpD
MTNWRRIVGILVLAHLSFAALLLTAVAEQTVAASAGEPDPELTPVVVVATPEPPAETTRTGTDSPPEPLVDWANVELKDGRQSYLELDAPPGSADESQPLPAPLLPAPVEVEPVPTPAAPAAAPPSSDTLTSAQPLHYVVQAGDNLFRIARRHNVALEQLTSANNIGDPSRISVGQQLMIPHTGAIPVAPAGLADSQPGDGFYVVQSGDSPYLIARRFGISLDRLLALNDIANPRRLKPGQVLRLSEEVPAPATTVTAPAASPAPVTTAAAGVLNGNVYMMQAGDIPYNIARRFGISVDALLAANQITDPRRLQIGQQLIIPEPETTPSPVSAPASAAPQAPVAGPGTYTVQRGDIPASIARRFGISVNGLLAANNITDPTRLQIGQVLVIPTPGPPPAPAGAHSGPSPFVWPVESRSISQRFRSGHGAIDIRSAVGSAVGAAAAGTVEFAGWNNQGYGYLVVLDHGNGFRTLYAHNSSVNVKAGQEVAQSELIALSGNTGRSSGPHLHLELLLDYRPVNPCLYLPGGC